MHTRTSDAEVRLLPWLERPDLLAAFKQQQRLALLIAGSFAVNTHHLLADPLPPKLILHLGELTQFSDWLPTAGDRERLQFAATLCDSITTAIAAGLFHGALSDKAIFVTDLNQPKIDFLHRFYDPDSANAVVDEDQDATALHVLLCSIAKPILSKDASHSQLDRQSRAALSRLFQPLAPTDSALNNLGLWNQWFTRSCPVATTSRLDAESSTTQLAQLHDNVVDNDATCEVQVQISQTSSVCSDNDSTSEFNIESAAIASISRSVTSLPTSGASETLCAGDRLGRFEVQKLLGSGGMGSVYRATDLSNDETVALKVLRTHSSDIAQSIRRFKKEARILASVQNQYVTRLIDAGVAGQRHYIAMEFIDGLNLKQWLQDRLPLSEHSSLRLTANIARALVDAHRQNIIHRDVKPENVLLCKNPSSCSTPSLTSLDSAAGQAHESTDDALKNLLVKLTDFGIARSMDQSVSMDVTRAGSLLGTPLFMAPEQCKGTDALTPAADIYSLGITLYMLLCGEPPFQSDDPMKLAAMHCFESPTNIRKKNANISEPTAAIVHRMLAKQPGERFADASQCLRAIEQLLNGQPSDIQMHPRLPENPGIRVWEKVLRWECASSCAELWPLVSNTERLNRAAGFQSVRYRTEKKSEGGTRRFGAVRVAGMQIEWEEHPFEWIEGYRMGVLREFSRGPFVWLSSVVQVTPEPSGGSTLTHTLRILPRNAVGWAVATVEVGWKASKALDKVYRRIDQTIQSSKKQKANLQPHIEDPFTPPARLRTTRQQRLEQRIERMIELGSALDHTSLLANYVRKASPQVLARIRPNELAHCLRLPPAVALDLCLVAAKCGMLSMKWEILCPTCRVPTKTRSLLTEIDNHTDCEACNLQFQSNLASAIELVFQADADIAEIDIAPYCVGGPQHSPHVICQLRLAPGEHIEVEVPLSVGDYLLRGPAMTQSQTLQARVGVAVSQLDTRLSQLGSSSHNPLVRAGSVTLLLTNDYEHEQIIRLERTIKQQDVITAAVASASPRFRELFPEQTFKRDLPVESEQLTLVGIRVSNALRLAQEFGETEAYLAIQKALHRSEAMVTANGGATVKEMGEWMLASFHDSGSAFQAARQISTSWDHQDSLETALGIAIHRGPVLVATQNCRLDYFGLTVRILESLTQLADRQMVLSDAVFVDPAVATLLQKFDLTGPTEFHTSPVGKKFLIQKINITGRESS